MRRKTKLSILYFLQYFIWGSWMVTLGTYLLNVLEYSGREVGIVYTSTAIGATITPFLLGRIADQRFPANRLLALANLIGAAGILLASFIKPFGLFFPVLVLYTLLYMPSTSLANAISLYHLKTPRQDYPRVRVWGTVGWVVAGVLVSALGWEPTPYPMRVSAAGSLALGLFAFTLPHTPPMGAQARRGWEAVFGPELKVLFGRRNVAVLFICLGLIAVPGAFYYSFVNPYLTELGMPYPAGIMALGQVAEVLVMLVMPFFLHRLRFKWLILMGLLSWGLRYLFFAYGNAQGLAWLIYLGIFLHGPAFNFSILASQIWIDEQMPRSLRNTAQGFISLLTLGFMAWVGSYLAGEVVQTFTSPDGLHDWTGIWWVPAGVGMGAAVFFLFAFRTKREE